MTRLLSDHLQPSGQRLGRQDGGLIPCSKSTHHPHHPAMEECAWCEPEEDAFGAADTVPPPSGEWDFYSDWTCKACSSLNFGGNSTRCWFCNCPGGTP